MPEKQARCNLSFYGIIQAAMAGSMPFIQGAGTRNAGYCL